MRKKLSALFLVVSILALVPVVSTSAKRPLVGTMDLQFNLGWPGPQQTTIPDWIGNIEIGENAYGMAFFAIGTGRPFEVQNEGSAYFFEEIWRIYETINYVFDENGVLQDWDHGEVLLWGYDEGLTNMKNSKYHMLGLVEEAVGSFTVWSGRHVYMSGNIIWYPFEAPHYAPGTMRIN
ncbi:MAG: hypothetical protein ACFFE8_12605 [Candidatus Heimdallarchaeota archaeon]